MQTFVETLFEHLQHTPPVQALLWLLLGMLLESTAIPVPSEIVLPAAGIWIAQGKFGSGVGGFLEAMLAVMAGSLVGSSISYAIGYYGGKPLLNRFGRVFRVTPEKLQASEGWIKRHGAWAIALGRLMFGVRHAQSLVAGSLRMSFRSFLACTFAGCAIWNILGVYLGYRYQEHIRTWLNRIGLGTFAAAIAIALLFWGFSRWRGQQKDVTGDEKANSDGH